MLYPLDHSYPVIQVCIRKVRWRQTYRQTDISQIGWSSQRMLIALKTKHHRTEKKITEREEHWLSIKEWLSMPTNVYYSCVTTGLMYVPCFEHLIIFPHEILEHSFQCSKANWRPAPFLYCHLFSVLWCLFYSSEVPEMPQMSKFQLAQLSDDATHITVHMQFTQCKKIRVTQYCKNLA